uniref:Uncharacterized protein n=1 Tax=Anguilla anguilla TaxID=7936 RepID=A0A0E9U4L6_ANGAN
MESYRISIYLRNQTSRVGKEGKLKMAQLAS